LHELKWLLTETAATTARTGNTGLCYIWYYL